MGQKGNLRKTEKGKNLKNQKATPTKLDTQVHFTVFMASGSLNVNIVIAFA